MVTISYAGIGGERDANPAILQGVGEALGREQVTAGATRADENQGGEDGHCISPGTAEGMVPGGRWLTAVVRGRLRVRATRKPMPSASEISEEPP
jgi:hypothetical protein